MHSRSLTVYADVQPDLALMKDVNLSPSKHTDYAPHSCVVHHGTSTDPTDDLYDACCSEHERHNAVRCLLSPLLPLLPKLPLQQVILRLRPIDHPDTYTRQVGHDGRHDQLRDARTAQPRLREERTIAQQQHEVPRYQEEPSCVARVAHDSVRSRGDETVAVPGPNVPCEEIA